MASRRKGGFAAGRPPKYKTPEEMQAKIDAYFTSCQGQAATNADGEALLDKNGLPVMIGARPPTVTGLALALGFTSRQALLNYQARGAFVDTITRAKSRVEEYAEARLFDKEGAAGAKFSLANNFRGWAEKVETDVNGGIRVVLPEGVKELGE